MKHPSFRELQDYFEGEKGTSEQTRLKEHLKECHRCSEVLAQMAKIDTLFLNSQEKEISQNTKKAIFSKAQELLIQKKKLNLKRKQKEEKIQNLIESLNSLRHDAIEELKAPILQSASIGMLLFIITKIGTTHTEIKKFKIIDDEIRITYSDLNLKGDEYENL